MKDVTLKLENADGLHARPAGMLAKAASGFQSKIELRSKGLSKNAKSIMSILSMSLEHGDEVQIVADGTDEGPAVEALRGLFQNKFAE